MDGDDHNKGVLTRIISMMDQSAEILKTINDVRPSDPELALRTYLRGIKKIKFALHLVEYFPELQVCTLLLYQIYDILIKEKVFSSRASLPYLLIAVLSKKLATVH